MQRYFMDAGKNGKVMPVKKANGSWVRYDDAQAEIERLTAERDAWKANAEALGEALGLLAIATGRMDAEGKVTAALAAHAKLKGAGA